MKSKPNIHKYLQISKINKNNNNFSFLHKYQAKGNDDQTLIIIKMNFTFSMQLLQIPQCELLGGL